MLNSAIGENRSVLTQIDYHIFRLRHLSPHNTNPSTLHESSLGWELSWERKNMLRKTNGIFRLKKEPFIMRALSEIYIRIVTQATRCCSFCRSLSSQIFRGRKQSTLSIIHHCFLLCRFDEKFFFTGVF